MTILFERLCVIGVGLIGGSVAAGLRRHGLVREVAGVDADAANLEAALAAGVIDTALSNIEAGAAGADCVLIGTPVGAIEAVLTALRPAWSESAVYTDVGSTKGNVLAAAGRVFGQVPTNFVPGHPIAGAERSGVLAARDDLFSGKRVILTPSEHNTPAAIDRISELWEGIGASVFRMDAVHHDEILAATSHLPHVLAYVLTAMLGRKDEQREIFSYAAGGFRDFTRIASSDPKMWVDICLANRDELVSLIEQFRDDLLTAKQLVAAERADALSALFSEARDARQRFLDQLQE